MSIELHVVEKTQAGVKGGGKVKYSVNTTVRMPIREREFIDNLSKNYNIGTPDIIRVLYAAAEEVLNQLELGNSVELPRLGIFSVSVSHPSKEHPSEVKVSNISKVNVNFRASLWLKKKMSKVKFNLKRKRS